jgi:hypothetical protein
MTIRFYRSSDFGAPSLAGVAGSLITLLDACLVNGYGNQTVTITRSGSTATIKTSSPHGLVKRATYTISGADQAEYNGVKAVSVVDTTTLAFTVVGTPATPATGTITAKLDGAGWGKPFSGTNKAAYQPGVGNRFYMRIDDTGTGTALLARVVGYENMTGIDTGTNAFPTDAQAAGGLYFPKANDTAAKPWLMVASEKHFVFITNPSNSTDWNSSVGVFFGEIPSLKPGDLYATQIIAHNSTSLALNFIPLLATTSAGTNSAGHYIARPLSQIAGAYNNAKLTHAAKTNNNYMGAGGLAYPTANNMLYMAPVEFCEPNAIRGKMQGVWCPLHNKPLQNMDMFDGSGDLAGKSFVAVNMYSSCQVFLEISDTF